MPGLFYSRNLGTEQLLFIFCYVKSLRNFLPIDTERKKKKKSSSNPTVLSFPPFFFHISVMHFSSMFIHSSLSRVIQMISGSDEGDKAKASKVMLVHKRHDKIHTASMQKCGWRCGFLRVKSVCKSEIKGGFSQLNCEK